MDVEDLDENNGREGVKNFELSTLISVDSLPEPFRPVFADYIYLNRIQTTVFADVFQTDEPIVVSAPTGSGKTVIFELAILRLLNSLENTDELSSIKIIYVSPMKALCQERFMDWQTKFSCVNLNCISVTGDNDTPMNQLFNQNLIITTPEKWDALTRRWRQNIYFFKNIFLFLIDEVHLLGDERGPTLEAIVSRMKTIGDNLSNGPRLRFVAVSATIPNVVDVAEWLGRQSAPAKYFSFDQETRPVKLTKIVHGYYYNPKLSTPFKFDIMLNYKLQNLILQYSEGKPTLIFCSTRKSVEMTAKHLTQNLTIRLDPDNKEILRNGSLQMKGPNSNNEGVVHGVGAHHAGMLPENRKILEDLFRSGKLPVLVTTSTLAMGVNLPAHLVIIKSTKYYTDGEYRDYTETTLLQMIGRAGRPQFDRSATAIILTTASDKGKYENMTNGSQPIESRLHKNLTEYLNAEIVLGTITDLGVAMQWVSTTFLFIRAKKNPKHYGIPLGLTPEQLDRKMLDMCQIEINKLAKVGMLTIDQTGELKPTNMGAIMAKYHLRFDTMKLFKDVTGNEILQQILSLISRCSEFSEMFLRANDKKTLNLLNSCKDRETIRFPLSGKIKTLDMKINCIIQAVFGCLQILEPSLQNEAQKILRIGERISKCLAEYIETKTKCYSALYSALILSQCFCSKLWENSVYVCRQLTGIGPVMSKNLVNAGKTSFKLLMEANPRNLEMILNRKSPMGDNIQRDIEHLPQYKLNLEVEYIKPSVAKVKVIIKLLNYENLQTKITTEQDSFMSLLIGDKNNNDVLMYHKYSHAYMVEKQEIQIILDQEFDKEVTLNTHFLSENWAGLDCNHKLELFSNKLNKPECNIKNVNKTTNSSILLQPTKKVRIDDYFKVVKNKCNLQQPELPKVQLEGDKISPAPKQIDKNHEIALREELLLFDSDSDDKIFDAIDESFLLNSDFDDLENHLEINKPIEDKNINEKPKIEIFHFNHDDTFDEEYLNEEDFLNEEFINTEIPPTKNDSVKESNNRVLINLQDVVSTQVLNLSVNSGNSTKENDKASNKDFNAMYEEFMNEDDYIFNAEILDEIDNYSLDKNYAKNNTCGDSNINSESNEITKTKNFNAQDQDYKKNKNHPFFQKNDKLVEKNTKHVNNNVSKSNLVEISNVSNKNPKIIQSPYNESPKIKILSNTVLNNQRASSKDSKKMEELKKHYDEMQQNIGINPINKENIIPINNYEHTRNVNHKNEHYNITKPCTFPKMNKEYHQEHTTCVPNKSVSNYEEFMNEDDSIFNAETLDKLDNYILDKKISIKNNVCGSSNINSQSNEITKDFNAQDSSEQNLSHDQDYKKGNINLEHQLNENSDCSSYNEEIISINNTHKNHAFFQKIDKLIKKTKEQVNNVSKSNSVGISNVSNKNPKIIQSPNNENPKIKILSNTVLNNQRLSSKDLKKMEELKKHYDEIQQNIGLKPINNYKHTRNVNSKNEHYNIPKQCTLPNMNKEYHQEHTAIKCVPNKSLSNDANYLTDELNISRNNVSSSDVSFRGIAKSRLNSQLINRSRQRQRFSSYPYGKEVEHTYDQSSMNFPKNKMVPNTSGNFGDNLKQSHANRVYDQEFNNVRLQKKINYQEEHNQYPTNYMRTQSPILNQMPGNFRQTKYPEELSHNYARSNSPNEEEREHWFKNSQQEFENAKRNPFQNSLPTTLQSPEGENYNRLNSFNVNNRKMHSTFNRLSPFRSSEYNSFDPEINIQIFNTPDQIQNSINSSRRLGRNYIFDGENYLSNVPSGSKYDLNLNYNRTQPSFPNRTSIGQFPDQEYYPIFTQNIPRIKSERSRYDFNFEPLDAIDERLNLGNISPITEFDRSPFIKETYQSSKVTTPTYTKIREPQEVDNDDSDNESLFIKKIENKRKSYKEFEENLLEVPLKKRREKTLEEINIFSLEPKRQMETQNNPENKRDHFKNASSGKKNITWSHPLETTSAIEEKNIRQNTSGFNSLNDTASKVKKPVTKKFSLKGKAGSTLPITDEQNNCTESGEVEKSKKRLDNILSQAYGMVEKKKEEFKMQNNCYQDNLQSQNFITMPRKEYQYLDENQEVVKSLFVEELIPNPSYNRADTFSLRRSEDNNFSNRFCPGFEDNPFQDNNETFMMPNRNHTERQNLRNERDYIPNSSATPYRQINDDNISSRRQYSRFS